MKRTNKTFPTIILLFLSLSWLWLLPTTSYCASAEEINITAKTTLNLFAKEVTGGQEFLNKSSGVLVFPEVRLTGGRQTDC
jgi:hypothetical protein